MTCLSSLSASGALQDRRSATVEKWGLRASVVSVDSRDELVAYVRNEHPGVNRDALAPFDPYCNADYVFVVTWLKSREELVAEFPEVKRIDQRVAEGRWPCLYVEFATQQAFYPMRPTASYGDTEMELRLYVIGSVELQTAPAFQRELRSDYFEQPKFDEGLPAEFLAGLPETRIPYTRIKTYTSASNFVDDLHFVPKPLNLTYPRIITWLTQPAAIVPTGLVLMLLVSYPCGGLAGLIVFHRWRRPALLGLFNCFTILGVGLALHRTKYETLSSLPLEPKNDHPKMAYLLVFSLLFTATTLAITWLSEWPL
jgi:hypothetical protein